MIVNQNLKIKRQAFHVALTRYQNNPWYKRIEYFSSSLIVTLQIGSIINLFLEFTSSNALMITLLVIMSYIATDFISGIAHMIGDNNTHYTSIISPYVAAFHMHHVRLTYKTNSAFKVYFFESGIKFWLLLYLVILILIQLNFSINTYLNIFLVCIGIFSSFAEVSHFLCHQNRNNRFIKFFQNVGILLSMKHHRIHHCNDNMHYAFLNGMTDALINKIAQRYCRGYKNNSDKHISFISVENK